MMADTTGRCNRILATYDYTDEAGTLLFQVLRYDPKQFRQRRPDGGGKWIYNLDDTRRVLYRLPELLQADPARHVFIVEGEKDADNLWAIDRVATTCPMGALKWREEYNATLKGRHVAILPDNDEPGRRHAQAVAKALDGVAASVAIVELPGLPPKGDVSDWLTVEGNDGDALLRLIQKAVDRGRQKCQQPDPPSTPARSPKSVRTLEPYRPFPLDTLAEPIRSYVSQAATALGCDPAFVALPALSVVSSAIGNSCVVRLKRTWHEPSVTWSAIVGDSGTLKSPAYQAAVAYLFSFQKRLMGEFKRKMAAYLEEVEAYKEKKKKAKEDDTDPSDPPEPPVLQRLICSDTTIEKLAEVLEDNPRGILVARDELSAWFGSFCRYKGKQGGTDLPNWLEMHRAGTILYDRKTGERRTVIVSRAAVSVTGGIQPGVLARVLTPEFLDAGLAARLLMAMPLKRPKQWTEMEIAEDVEKAYQKLLDGLIALEPDTEEKEKVPHVLVLSSDAKRLWVAFYNEWGGEQATAEGELAAAFSKLEGYAARFALIHHVVSHVGLASSAIRAIGVRSMEAGIALARWFAQETRRIYATLSESTEEREARRLVEFIQSRGGRITTRELQRSNSRKYPTADEAEAALEALVGEGLAHWPPQPTGTQGGRPARLLELCTTHDKTDTTSDADAETPERTPDATSSHTPPMPGESGISGSSVSFVMRHAQEGNSDGFQGGESSQGPPAGPSVGQAREAETEDPLTGDAYEGP
jgi:hypothetical protein